MAPSLMSAVLWSLAACAAFGLCNFILAYTVDNPRCDYLTNSGLVWLSSAVVGVVVYAMVTCSKGQNRRVVWREPQEISTQDLGSETRELPTLGVTFGMLRVAAVGGLGVGFAQLFMQLAFQEYPTAAGPLASVVCGDVILVSVYCHFVYGGSERLNKVQWAAVLGLFVGLSLIAQPDQAAGVGASAPTGSMAVALVYAIVAMFSFGLSVIAVRWSFEEPHCTTSMGGFILRMFAMGAGGIVTLLLSAFKGTLASSLVPLGVDNWSLLVLPAFCGLLQAYGVYAINRALQYPSTGICIAIFGSNSIVVLVLNVVVKAQLPGTLQTCGMAAAVVSCSVMSLAARPETPQQDLLSSPARSIMSPKTYVANFVTTPTRASDTSARSVVQTSDSRA